MYILSVVICHKISEKIIKYREFTAEGVLALFYPSRVAKLNHMNVNFVCHSPLSSKKLVGHNADSVFINRKK